MTIPLTHPDQERAEADRRAEAEARFLERDRYDLAASITRISPEFERPDHLAKFCSLFDRIARGESVFALVEAPPRHGKSETVFHGIARAIHYQGLRCCYSTYSGAFAFRKSRRIRELALRYGAFAGSERENKSGGFAGSTAVSAWETDNGGSLVAGGRGGAYKGEGFDLVALDDPYKNRAEYESPVVREDVRELLKGTLRDRVEPGGSVIIFHQRWGRDDLIATIAAEDELNRWERVTLPVLEEYQEDDNGHIIGGVPLWPKRYGLEELRALKADVGTYNWWSQFMQKPRIRGERVFEDPHYYRELPSAGFRVAFGLDMSYSEKTKSDFTVCLRGVAVGSNIYLTGMLRTQATIISATGALQKFTEADKMAPVRWYIGGQEKAVAANLKKDTGILIRPRPAVGDKFTRAAQGAKAWNRGQVMLPAGERWVNDLLAEVTNFTGTKADVHDDIVDALAALFDELVAVSGWGAVL